MKRARIIVLLVFCGGLIAAAQSTNKDTETTKIRNNEKEASSHVVFTNTAEIHNIDLMAMLNSLPHSTSRMIPGGGTIELGSGVFYTSANSFYSNSVGVDTVTLRGKGVVSTALVITNAGELLRTVGNNNNIGLILDGILLAATTDSTNALVHLQNGNRVRITDTTFHYWPAATKNAGFGLEVGFLGGDSPNATNLGGLWIEYGSGEQISLYDCNFDALKWGIYGMWDHLNLYHVFFEMIGVQIGENGIVPRGTDWPKTDLRSLGGSITAVSGFQDNLFLSTHFFACAWPFVNGLSGRPHGQFNTVFEGGQIEGIDGHLMLSVPDAGGRVIFRDMDYFNARPEMQVITNSPSGWVASSGTISNVFEFSTRGGRDYVMKVAGHENLRLKNDGSVRGNFLLTNIPTNALDATAYSAMVNKGQNTFNFDFANEVISAPTVGEKYTNTFGQRIRGSLIMVCNSVGGGNAYGTLVYYNAIRNVTNSTPPFGVGGAAMTEMLPVPLPALSPGDWWMVTNNTTSAATISLTNVWYWKE